MQGITILNETLVYVPNTMQLIFLIISFVGFSIMAFIDDLCNTVLTRYIFIIFTISTLISAILFICFKPVVNHIEYDVVLDTSVSYVDFTSKYIVVKQNENIYTIKERD